VAHVVNIREAKTNLAKLIAMVLGTRRAATSPAGSRSIRIAPP
jgi:hypothetical protein